MIVTHPLPNEFSYGHLGRITRLNGGKPYKKANYTLVANFASQQSGEKPISPLHALASIADMEPIRYACTHTLLPFHSFAFEKDTDGQARNWRTAHYRRFGTSAKNPYAALCKECIVDDEKHHGFSYWHREHQIPGMYTCAKHRGPLLLVPSQNAFFKTPREFIGQSLNDGPSIETESENSAVSRYQEVAMLMLEKGAPDSLARVRDHIAARSEFMGLVSRAISKDERLVSDCVFRTFSRSWLAFAFPNSSTKRMGHGCYVFEHVTQPFGAHRPSAAAIAAVLATLFDSAEQALNTIFSSDELLLGEQIKHGDSEATILHRTPWSVAHESAKVAQALLQHKGDVDAVAMSLGCTAEQVQWRMHSHRDYILKALHPTREYRAMETFLSGMSLQDTSKHHNVPIPVLETLLRLFHRQVTLANPLPSARS